MRRNRDVPDIKQRLRLFELRFGFTKDVNWLDLLGYTNEASVSRVKNGKQGISESAINRICDASGIKKADFALPLIELAELLGIAEDGDAAEILASIAASSSELSEELHSVDKEMLAKLPGSYIMLYPGREEMHIARIPQVNL